LATSIVCGKEIADQLDNIDRLLAKVRNKARAPHAIVNPFICM
jgi:hypothetical protein